MGTRFQTPFPEGAVLPGNQHYWGISVTTPEPMRMPSENT
jgi:hypothetical protein